MYIYKLVVENFRNCKSFEWKPTKGLNIIFGPNGIGKTTLAEAMSLVFSSNRFDNYFEKSDFYKGDTNLKIKIQVWLKEFEDIGITISDKIQFIDKDDKLIVDDGNTDAIPVVIYQLESDLEQKMEWSFYNVNQPIHCKIADRQAINYIHIGADRQPHKELGMQTSSTFYKLSKDIIETELNIITKEIIEFADDKLNESLEINRYLEELKNMSVLNIIENYSLMIKSPISTWNSSGFELGSVIGDTKLSFNKHSKGIQNILLLLLMKQQLNKAGIVFIEELEQNLEPKRQRYIAGEYKNLTSGQVFITSHSPDIISHFDYENVGMMTDTTILSILKGVEKIGSNIKEIYRFNKKEFLAALMAQNVLLVEGESEFESFPIYSNASDFSFDKYDIEMIRMGGKAKVDIYCKLFKYFNKKVFVLLDNDPDITNVLNKARNNADNVYLAMNSYEDLIYRYHPSYLNKLNELVDFSYVRQKLISIYEQNVPKGKDIKIKEEMTANQIDPKSLRSYEDLWNNKVLIEYIMHDSFAAAYYARAVANFIVEEGIVPTAFTEMIKHISGEEGGLQVYKTYSNVYEIRG